MINEDRRKVIHTLFAEGKKKKDIARLLNVSVKTVRKILSTGTDYSAKVRCDKKDIDIELLRSLYERCDGYVQRVHEILKQEEKIDIGYSTLTRMIRHYGIGQKIDRRCYHVEDVPGAEMQHDTTSYKLKIGIEYHRVICSGLYLRYSKMRYIKFYPQFNRFKMKCFFYEALTFWKYVAKVCVIDNTNLAVLHGTGEQAVFHPEMISFAKPYGFEWIAHEKGHANRKAGMERNFWTVETNFLPGRSFESMEDLNHQAFEWATSQYANRPLSKTRLIPISLFEQEKPYLTKLPSYVEPPYQYHQRDIDQYGYIAFNANYYWIPGKSVGEVSVVEYPNHIKIFPPNQQSIEYPLPAYNTRNKKYNPQGVYVKPCEPQNIKKPCDEEEKHLRALGETCCVYLDFIKSNKSEISQKPKFIRHLHHLSKNMSTSLFMTMIQRALKYSVTNIETLDRMSHQLMQKESCMPEITISQDYEQRESYQQGRCSHETQMDLYDELLKDRKENTEKDDNGE